MKNVTIKQIEKIYNAGTLSHGPQWYIGAMDNLRSVLSECGQPEIFLEDIRNDALATQDRISGISLQKVIKGMSKGERIFPIVVVYSPEFDSELILDGHTRTLAHHRQGQTNVPAILVHGDSPQYRAYLQRMEFEASRIGPKRVYQLPLTTE